MARVEYEEDGRWVEFRAPMVSPLSHNAYTVVVDLTSPRWHIGTFDSRKLRIDGKEASCVHGTHCTAGAIVLSVFMPVQRPE